MPLLWAPVLGLLTAISITISAMASDRTDEQTLQAIWQSPEASTTLFSARFLEQIPPDRLEPILRDMIGRCGAVERVETSETAGEYRLLTERCMIPTVIGRNAGGEIDHLRFDQPIKRNTSLVDILAEIEAFEGQVAYAVTENGRLINGHDADRTMAVGSAFKLVVLSALQDLIERGDANWSDVVTLEEKHISLPSGRLQDMPIGSPFTLHTLAAAMIAESDNTATDLLIDIVGRERLEVLSGLVPFLTTRELFQLKADDALFQRYREADPLGRHAVLTDLADAPLPSLQDVSTLWQKEAEWLLSTGVLCGWMDKVASLELMQINPGVVRAVDGDRVAYKGGSEIGVLNFTTEVDDGQGRRFCVSVTWNASGPIDEASHAQLYAALVHELKKRP